MSVIALIVFVALLIPIMAIVVDSPIGGRWRGGWKVRRQAPPGLAELAKKVELLEAEVDELAGLQTLQDENAFLQRLLESSPRPTLPPPSRPERPHRGGPPGRRRWSPRASC